MVNCAIQIQKANGTHSKVILHRPAPIAEHLSTRLLILQCVLSVGGVWCRASGMQLVTPRNAISHAQECTKKLYMRIFLSAVAALVVSLLRCQMAKVVM